MNNDAIKSANRKALPKFILLTLISTAAGGAVGYISAKYGLDAMAGSIKSAGAFFGAHIAPWLIAAMAVIVPAVCIPIYCGAKALMACWDGEDEEISERIDRKLSAALWVGSAATIVNFFLLAVVYSGGFGAFRRPVPFIVAVAAFIAVMVETIIIQQRCVDAVKRMNPEKTASVYDVKFQRKWMDSCDEAEKLMIGKCAYKAYAAANTACAVLAIIFAVCALIFNTGFLPPFAVCVIWFVLQFIYYRETIRYSKAGNRIS